MRPRRLRLASYISVAIVFRALSAAAQTSRDSWPPERCWFARLPLELTGGLRGGAPLKASAFAGVAVLNQCWYPETAHGVEITGEAGLSGRGASVGFYFRDEMVVTGRFLVAYYHTSRSPWLAAPNGDFIGPEVRLTGQGIGVALGVLHRLDAGKRRWALGLSASLDGWLCCTSLRPR